MVSPFESILHTNTVPSDTECQKIRDFLEGPRKEVADLTDELKHLDSLRRELFRKRGQLEQLIDDHLALVSPVRRLPEDVVRAIFMASLPSTRNPAIVGKEAPLLLCQISQYWRSIALSTPRLWAAIHIVIPDESRLQRLVEQLAIWFERSGVVPLHISMIFSIASGVGCDLSPILSALTAVSRRWRSIELPLPAGPPLSSVSAEDVPLLETVKISHLDFSDLGGSTMDDGAFLATKSLRSLTLPANYNCQETPISWRFLRHLIITPGADAWGAWGNRFTCPVALTILRQCTALQTCEFNLTDSFQREDDLIPTDEFTLPQLLHLSITRYNPTPGSRLFGTVILPNLRSLRYDVRGGPPDIGSELPRLLPSTPSLQSFTIQAPGLGSDGLLEVLSHLPTLKDLVILAEPYKNTDPPWAQAPEEKFLDHLSLGSATVVCPLLEAIQLHNFFAASDEALLEFIRSRTRPQLEDVGHLSHVAATFRRAMDFDIMPHLQDAVSRGLVVSLNYLSGGRPAIYSPLEGTDDYNFSGDWEPNTWGQQW